LNSQDDIKTKYKISGFETTITEVRLNFGNCTLKTEPNYYEVVL